MEAAEVAGSAVVAAVAVVVEAVAVVAAAVVAVAAVVVAAVEAVEASATGGSNPRFFADTVASAVSASLQLQVVAIARPPGARSVSTKTRGLLGALLVVET